LRVRPPVGRIRDEAGHQIIATQWQRPCHGDRFDVMIDGVLAGAPVGFEQTADFVPTSWHRQIHGQATRAAEPGWT
jgi:hypothetical protein